MTSSSTTSWDSWTGCCRRRPPGCSTWARAWGARGLLAAAGAVPGNEPADDEQRLDDALRWWRYDHDRDPPLHDGAAMLAAIDRRFRIAAVRRVPHLWRYLGQDLPDGPRGSALATRLRALETALVDAGALAPVGLRVVAVVNA